MTPKAVPPARGGHHTPSSRPPSRGGHSGAPGMPRGGAHGGVGGGAPLPGPGARSGTPLPRGGSRGGTPLPRGGARGASASPSHAAAVTTTRPTAAGNALAHSGGSNLSHVFPFSVTDVNSTSGNTSAHSGGSNLSHIFNSNFTDGSSPALPGPKAAPANAPPASVKQSDEAATPSKRTRDSEGHEPQKRVKRDYTDTITVIVGGPDGGEAFGEFTVHKDLICQKSTFFAAACNKEWVEGKTGIVRLPTQTAKIFQYYVDWVYSSWLNTDELWDSPWPWALREYMKDPSSAVSHGMQMRTVCDILCRLLILADFLGDIAAKKACMKMLVHDMEYPATGMLMDNTTVEFISGNTDSDSGLFRWTVDKLAEDMNNHSRALDPPARYLSRFPAVVKDALLHKTFVALRPGSSLEPVGNDESKYFD